MSPPPPPFFCGVRDDCEYHTARVIWNWKFVTWFVYDIDVRTVWFAADLNVFSSFRLRSQSFILREMTEEVKSDKNLWLTRSFDTFNCVEMIIDMKLTI